MSECGNCPTKDILIEISRQLGELQGLMDESRKDQHEVWQEIVSLRRDVDAAKEALSAIGDPKDIRYNSELVGKIRRRVILITSTVGSLSFISGANAEHILSILKHLMEIMK